MKVTYLEDGVRKSITCDYFNYLSSGSVVFHWNDGKDDYGLPQERTLITLPDTKIELVE